MADNVTLNAMAGGSTVSADDLGGVVVQRVKVQYGPDGSATDVSTSSPLPVTLANTATNATPVKVDGSGVTQPVSGTVTVTPSGTQTVSGTVAVSSAPTTAVTAGSLPLPTGASTAAKQPALGTAGAASADVLSVQGVASMTALKTDGSGVTQPVSLAANQSFNNAQINGVTPLMGNGASGTGAQRVTIASDSTGQVALAAGANTVGSVNQGTSPWVVNTGSAVGSAFPANAFGVGVSDGTNLVALRQNSNAFNSAAGGGVNANNIAQFDDVSPTAITENNFGNMRISANRNLYTTLRDAAGNERGVNVTAGNALTVDASATTQPVSGNVNATPKTATSGGPTVNRVKAAASTNATSVKASAGQIYGYDLSNQAAYDVFLKIYNKASAPTVGTDTPAFTIKVPAGGGRNVEYSLGIPLGTGIAYAITKLVADTDTTVVVADDLHGFLLTA